MEILDRLHLTQDKSLLIVKVAQRRLLLSITQQNISKVLEFSEDEAIISIDQGNTTNFSNLLKDTMTKSTFFKKNTQEHKEENP
jgi:flagellar biogenesis protein FliO